MKYTTVFLLLFLLHSIQGTSNNLPDKYCQIISKRNNKSINITGASLRQGENLLLWYKWDCRSNQEWKLEPHNNYFIIRSLYNDMVISSNNDSVQQSMFQGNDNQLWDIKQYNDGYLILSKKNQQALTVARKTPFKFELTLRKRNNKNSQIWYFEPSGIEYEKTNFNRILTVEEMKADIEYFFNKLYEVHVNPYAFVSKDSVAHRKKELLQQVSEPMEVFKFCSVISSINGLFDGHTGMPAMDYDYIESYRKRYGRFFPYAINYKGEAFYLKSDVDSLKHKKIKAINGISSSEIQTGIEKRINYENRFFRNRTIERNFGTLLLGIFELKPPFTLCVTDTLSQTEKTFQHDGLAFWQFPQQSHTNPKSYSFRQFTDDSIAIIEYNTCQPNDLKAFNNYIDKAFSEIKQNGIKHLFIDISRNGGGSTSTNKIFYKNINHQPKDWYEDYTKKISQESKLHTMGLSLYNSSESFEKRMKKYKKRIQSKELSNWEKDIISIENGGFFHKDIYYCKDEVLDGYANNLYIIQSHQTYSAAVDMSAWFKYSEVGKLIGTESGGMSAVYIEGIPFVFPNSKLRFRVSDNYSSYPNGSLDKGIMPDVFLPDNFYKDQYSLEDLKEFIEKTQE